MAYKHLRFRWQVVKLLWSVVWKYREKGVCELSKSKRTRQEYRGKHLQPDHSSAPSPHEESRPHSQTPPNPTARPKRKERGSFRSFATKHPDAVSICKKFLFFFTVFTLSLYLWGWDVWICISENFLRGFGILAGSGIAFETVFELWKNRKNLKGGTSDTMQEHLSGKAPDGESWTQSTDEFITDIIAFISEFRVFRAAIVISLIIMTSSFSAHALCEGWDLHFDGIRHLNETVEASQPIHEPDIDSDAEPGKDGLEQPSLPQKLETPSEEATSPAAFLLEPGRLYTLSEKEMKDLFFLGGSYTITDWLSPEMYGADEPITPSVSYEITDWNSPSKIAAEIKPFLEDLCSQQVANLFDENAPEPVRGDISNASESQKEMVNSEQLDQIISVRLETWQEYPKFGIADLLANNMQRYAQEYLKIDGQYETIKYYYAQSIFWSLKSLVFSSADATMRKNTLNYISMRYHDIADMAVDESIDQLCASALSDAFQLLENMDLASTYISAPEDAPESAVSVEDTLPSSLG